MKTFTFDGSWNQIKGVLRQKFAQLTDADLEFIQGKGEELLGRLETKLGMSWAEVENMLEDIKESLTTGAGAVHEKIGQVKSKVTEFAGQWKDKASTMAGDAGARAGEFYTEGRRQARTLHALAEDQVKRNPREAILAAFATGFVIGLLIRRL